MNEAGLLANVPFLSVVVCNKCCSVPPKVIREIVIIDIHRLLPSSAPQFGIISAQMHPRSIAVRTPTMICNRSDG